MDERGTEVNLAACRAYVQARQRQRERSQEADRQHLVQRVREAVGSMMCGFPQVRRVYLFGSSIRRGALRRDSDLDIAVEGILHAEAYFAFWRKLEEAMPGQTVDLVELDRDLRFAERVRQTGEVIYERPDSDTEGGHPG